MNRYQVISLLILVALSNPISAAEGARWYNDEQVNQGQQVFAKNCAVCHGAQAEATPEWRQRDALGNYRAPPLDGSAHTWHHPMKILKRTISKGGALVGGTMPAFESRLSNDEINAVIAWFQAKWGDDIYAQWSKRNTNTGFQTPKKQQLKQAGSMTRLLKLRLPDIEIGTPTSTPVKGLHQAKVGSDYAYLLANGRYALLGELIDLQTGENLTETAKRQDVLSLLRRHAESDMVIFPALNSTQQTITILTDTDCPLCRKLHKEIPLLQKADIRVRYIPFPRGGKQAKSYKIMQSVWCAKDKTAAMNIAKGIQTARLNSGDCSAASAIDRGYELGLKIGLRGPLGIILGNGQILEGYLPASKLIPLVRANP